MVDAWQRLAEATLALEPIMSQRQPPQIGVVLGSGLGAFTQRLHHQESVPYSEIPGFETPTIPGHAGSLVFGTIGSGKEEKEVVVAAGRMHPYEGHSMQTAVHPVRLMCHLGAQAIILTNAAGGIRNVDLQPGDLVALTDQVDFTGDCALYGPNDKRLGERFVDMTKVYDGLLLRHTLSCMDALGITAKHGVYLRLRGPRYETPAEIRALKAFGADLVGMSTTYEAVAARHMGRKVAGISLVTNMAAGLSSKTLSHAEVTETATANTSRFCDLLEAILSRPLAS